MTSFEKLQAACGRYGKRGLAKRLEISEAAIYLALRESRGLRPDYMDVIDKLLQSHSPQMAASAPNASITPTQPSGPSDTAAELQLLSTWLQGLSKTNLIKVIEFVAELKRSEET